MILTDSFSVKMLNQIYKFVIYNKNVFARSVHDEKQRKWNPIESV